MTWRKELLAEFVPHEILLENVANCRIPEYLIEQKKISCRQILETLFNKLFKFLGPDPLGCFLTDNMGKADDNGFSLGNR